MLSLQKLQEEGLVPLDVGNTGGSVAFGEYYCIYWGSLRPEEIGKMSFTDEDFYCIYLQIENGTADGHPFQRVAVKMSINEDEAGHPFEKERVRDARKQIQDYFACNIAGCQRTRFQFSSPKLNKERASWLTICRFEFDDDNYQKRISAVQKAFDALKK